MSFWKVKFALWSIPKFPIWHNTINKKFLQANILIAWQKINEQDYLRLTSWDDGIKLIQEPCLLATQSRWDAFTSIFILNILPLITNSQLATFLWTVEWTAWTRLKSTLFDYRMHPCRKGGGKVKHSFILRLKFMETSII